MILVTEAIQSLVDHIEDVLLLLFSEICCRDLRLIEFCACLLSLHVGWELGDELHLIISGRFLQDSLLTRSVIGHIAQFNFWEAA